MIYFLFLLLGLLSSCDENEFINKATDSICKLAKKKYNLECQGSGFQGPNQIRNFRFVFEYNFDLTEDEARSIIVQLTEDYINYVNSNPDVLKNMFNPPINENHAFILIGFPDSNREFKSELSGILNAQGKIQYLKYTDKLEPYKTEDYSEAYFKVYGTQLNRH